MYQPISLMILRIIVVMTHDYFKCCNASLLIYKIYINSFINMLIHWCINFVVSAKLVTVGYSFHSKKIIFHLFIHIKIYIIFKQLLIFNKIKSILIQYFI